MYQSNQNKMRVIKRSGKYEEVSFDKILNRIKALSSSDEFSKTFHLLKVYKKIS